MRVAIDTNGLYTTQAGVARYIRGLLRGLKSVTGPLDAFEFAWEVENFAYAQPQRALKTFYREFVWGPLLAGERLRRLRPDLVHTTSAVLYRPPPRLPHVATLHDLAVFRHPKRLRRWQVTTARLQLKRLARADKIICVSRFTADEAVALLGWSPDKLVVVHNGCDFQEKELCREAPPPETPPSEFLLFVGSLEPGKNLSLLKQVYQLARGRGTALPPLLVVGSRWEGVPGEGPPSNDWRYLGRQPDEVLVYLYRRARALVFPSKYEGFGLPVAEAMSLGCPVICSRAASIPEVGGEAALYAELTPESYLEALGRLLREDGLRSSLVSAGAAQAARFTWPRCGRETYEVYRSVCH